MILHIHCNDTHVSACTRYMIAAAGGELYLSHWKNMRSISTSLFSLSQHHPATSRMAGIALQASYVVGEAAQARHMWPDLLAASKIDGALQYSVDDGWAHPVSQSEVSAIQSILLAVISWRDIPQKKIRDLTGMYDGKFTDVGFRIIDK